MTGDVVQTFIEIVKENSMYSKCVQKDIVEKITSIFDVSYNKKQYPRKINNCMKIALNFYKHYNYNYYKMIINGLKTRSIIVDDEIQTSYTNSFQKNIYQVKRK